MTSKTDKVSYVSSWILVTGRGAILSMPVFQISQCTPGHTDIGTVNLHASTLQRPRRLSDSSVQGSEELCRQTADRQCTLRNSTLIVTKLPGYHIDTDTVQAPCRD